MARILIVDDHAVYQRMYSYILRKHGHSVLVASDIQAAINNVQQPSVDLIIADGTTSERDGIALIKQVRSNEQYSKMPMIMLTPFGQTRPMYEDMAANAYLSKPTSSRELIDTVHRLLGGRIVGGIE